MTTFLKRVWATLATFPVYAAALASGVSAVSGGIASHLPAGAAQTVTHVGIVVVAAITFGAAVVRLVTPVAAELRGFPKASLSAKAQMAQDLAAALAQIRVLEAAREAASAAVPLPVPAHAPDVPPVADPPAEVVA